jgi:[ribosomal protein S5]-alanine N-acetyltransferase
VIGFCGLTRVDNIDGQSEIEIGYRLARDYALGVLVLARLVSIMNPRNRPSIRVVEKIELPYKKDVILREKPHQQYHTADLGEPVAATDYPRESGPQAC